MSKISRTLNVFRDRIAPEPGSLLVGYGALIDHYGLQVVLPETLSAISSKHKKYSTDGWNVYSPQHTPEDSLIGHLTFALKYEGVDLAVLNALFQKIDGEEIADAVKREPTSKYARRLWFFYEWLTGKNLALEDATVANSVDALNPDEYYTGKPILSKRHRVRNNLPGVKNFCPLVRKTAKLESYISQKLQTLAHQKTQAVHPDVLARAAAFLLLKDSRASFDIEGEKPGKNRAERWGQAICNAGQSPLSVSEFERLQNIVIADQRFVAMGLRREGGFIGVHERFTNTPIPDHISARWQDLSLLISGLIETDELLRKSDIDSVVAAAIIAFGFVFIHPFEDGNGRIHRYLIHHVLNERKFAPNGIIFPISAAILNAVGDYKKILERHSKPRLALIEWHATAKGNVEILNETIDLYRYFDATKQTEFLYDCVHKTIAEILPEEVRYLERYDRMKNVINKRFDMPDYVSDLLIKLLEQNGGKLSGRAREKEFKMLTPEEISELENFYQEIFNNG